MRTVATVGEFQRLCRDAQRPLGLVLTMGALHEGHLGMVRSARSECATVAVSIYVNPVQFGPDEDLARYPRDLERDLELLRGEGVDFVFHPSTEEVYPPGSATGVDVGGPALGLEGDARPGHFRGVATVVTKLLLMALPDAAYFGQKDGQQVAVVRRLVADLHIPTRLQVVPTVREPDGLAVSSRNVYLSPDERAAAPVVARALAAARACFEGGERRSGALEAACRTVLEAEPLVDGVEYLALVDPDAFTRVNSVGDTQAMLAVAVRIGATRLIDNVLLGGERE